MNLTDPRCWFAGFLVVMAGLGLDATALADGGNPKVYLTGCLKEGAVEIPQGEHFTVVRAILSDGGTTEFADTKHVKILRQKADGTTETILVDLADILTNGHLEKDVSVQAGDIIVVPQRLVNY